jgi:hypothetical protein
VVPHGGVVIFEVSPAEMRALAGGETIVLTGGAGTAAAGDRIALRAGATDPPHPLKPAYRRWEEASVPGDWTATVAAVWRSDDFDPDRFSSRHVFATHPEGEILLLRVSGDRGAVLSETAFEARRRSVDQALR